MKLPAWIPVTFYLAALYDGLIGLVGIIAPVQAFRYSGIELPANMIFIQFPALLLIVAAIMFFNLARDPIANKNLIVYAVLFKLVYCVVVFGHAIFGGITFSWLLYAYCDIVFIAAFILAGLHVRKSE